MKTILVPTDFSECSCAAFDYAALIAKRSGAQIYLMHILDIPFAKTTSTGDVTTDRNSDVPFMMGMMKVTQAKMKKIKSLPVFKDIDVKDVIEVGSIPEKVFSAVKKYKADMIIMGTHGVSGLQEKFIGTNAEKIVRDVDIPVLTVKDRVKNPKIETIIFATDFSREAEYVLPMISNVAILFEARLILTKIITLNDFETTFETDKQIRKFRNKSKVYNYSTDIYYARTKEEGIRHVANKTAADVIALGTHGRHGLAHFFRGSIAEDVVSRASLPVLTINFHKKLMNGKASSQNGKAHHYDSDLLYQIPSV